MTTYVTREEVVAAHYFLMKKMNDAEQAGVKDHILLDSAVHKPQQSVFGEVIFTIEWIPPTYGTSICGCTPCR
jgi:hypothetical protein